MKIIKLVALLISASLALYFSGCGKSSQDSGDQKLRLAFVTNNAAPFWVIARAGAERAQSELGDVELDFRIPSSGSTSEQRQILDDLVVRGIDGIAVSPIDPANQTEFLNRVAGQTLLICHDSDAPDSDRVCYIGTDNIAAGKEAGNLIKQALPNGGSIMIFVGTMDAQNAKERHQGIQETLAGTNIEILGVRTDDTDRVRAQKNVEDTLVKYPDIAGVVGLWSYNGPAIINAVASAGKTGQVKIVTFDEEEETLAGVASGAVFGTVVQQPFEFGRQAITRMRNHLKGDADALAGGTQIVSTLNITQENVADFQARLNKLLGK
ncbi:MAG: sugar-binding protein [Verrucomicrobia bacterium]|nr:sugar-binding protein [Verrucomicrobiota bacterium]